MASQPAESGKPRRTRKRLAAGPAAEINPGQRRIVDLDGKRIGIFNVKGSYYALHNRCPHMAGALCAGPITGTTLPTEEVPPARREFVYGREGEILRCGWHGWEFDITTGQCLISTRIKARTYPVTVENGEIIVHI